MYNYVAFCRGESKLKKIDPLSFKLVSLFFSPCPQPGLHTDFIFLLERQIRYIG